MGFKRRSTGEGALAPGQSRRGKPEAVREVSSKRGVKRARGCQQRPYDWATPATGANEGLEFGLDSGGVGGMLHPYSMRGESTTRAKRKQRQKEKNTIGIRGGASERPSPCFAHPSIQVSILGATYV